MSRMKRMCCALVLGGIFAQNGHAETKVHFTGQLVSGPCSLVINGSNMAEVVFPAISAPELTVQRQSTPVPFILELKDCNTALSKGVSVRFSGQEVSGMSGFLALDSQSDAKGVGIGIATQTGARVMVNGTSGTKFALTTGLNSLNFNAWLQAIEGEDMTPGIFSATATVAFEYL